MHKDLIDGAGQDETDIKTEIDISRGGLSKARIKNIGLVLRRRRKQKLDPVNKPEQFKKY